MCYRLVTHILRNAELPPGPKLVLAMIADRVPWKGNECHIGQAAIARQCGMSERAVRSHIADLERQSFIERTRRQTSDGTRQVDGFRVLFHSEPAKSAGSERVIANRQIVRREPANSAKPHMYEASIRSEGAAPVDKSNGAAREANPGFSTRKFNPPDIGHTPQEIDAAARRLRVHPGRESYPEFRERLLRIQAQRRRPA